jgi:hypothetical protein
MPAKPDKKTQPKAYRAWVRGKLLHWDPADDRGTPEVYIPRRDGLLWEDTGREVHPNDIRFSADAAQLRARRLP